MCDRSQPASLLPHRPPARIASPALARRLTSLAPRWLRQAYHAAVRHLRKHDKVETALGGFWAPRGFKGYQVEPATYIPPNPKLTLS